MHIEKRPCEDMVKELLSASQEDRPHQKATPYTMAEVWETTITVEPQLGGHAGQGKPPGSSVSRYWSSFHAGHIF